MSLIELITIPFFNLMVWLLSSLPTLNLPSSFLTAVDTGVSYLTTLGYFVPLGTLAAIVGFYISYYFFKLIFHAMIFLMAFVPFLKRGK